MTEQKTCGQMFMVPSSASTYTCALPPEHEGRHKDAEGTESPGALFVESENDREIKQRLISQSQEKHR